MLDRESLEATEARLDKLSPGTRQLLEQRRRASSGAAQAGITPRPAGTRPTLSWAQERIWLLDRLNPGLSAYNSPRAVRLVGPLDILSLQKALDDIVARHEVLRTTIGDQAGEPVARVISDATVALRRVDLRGFDGDAEAEIQRLLTEEVARPFDLSNDVLLRGLVVQVDEEDHVLALVSHHIASDEQSKQVIASELQALYASYRAGDEPGLTPLALQYADYAAWQRSGAGSGKVEAELAYWTDRLDGAPAVLELPADYRRPDVETHRGTKLRTVLPAAASEALRAFGRGQKATLYMTLTAGFAALLEYWSGQEDLVIGTPISGRTHLELEPLIGFFSNTLALRLDGSGDPSFTELLGRVRTTAIDAYANQNLPFERLVEEVRPERDLSRNPIFQVMFTQRGGGVSVLQLDGLDSQPIAFDSPWTKFDLNVIAIDDPGGIIVVWEYSTDLFAPATIESLSERYIRLLVAAVAEPERPMSQFDLLLPGEAEDLAAWNTTDAATRETCLHTLIGERAAATPDAIAVRGEESQLTYGELWLESLRVARQLRSRSVGPGSLVGVWAERRPELLVAIVGILAAGGAYVPLEPTYPTDRLQFTITDAGIDLVVAGSDGAAVSALGLPVLLVDDPAVEDPADVVVPCPEVTPDDLAYVIFTSGSTGRPKGVMINHRGVVNLTEAMAIMPGLAQGEVMVGVTTPAFDLSVPDLFLPLTTGATLVLAGPQTASDPVALAGLIDRVGANLMQATPATWRLLCESGWLGRPGLRAVCGGEGYPASLVADLSARGIAVWNFYGPTEATVWAVACRVDDRPGDPVPMGWPLKNMRTHVLDSHGRLAPVGVTGDLYLSGVGLARGYLNRPQLTADSFVSGHEASGGAPCYRTGDLVRRRPDGALTFVGRADDQVKLRGYRIELGEIEAVLGEHPSVAQVVVVVREDLSGERVLVAYVVAARGAGPIQSPPLRALAEARLPSYMVPTHLVELPSIPLTANGKFDRRALPAPVRDQLLGTGRLAETPTEERVSDLYCQVLGMTIVAMDDNFFDLGGHSLSGSRLMARVNVAFGLGLPLRTLFEAPTVASLAARVEAALGSSGSRPLPSVDVQPRATHTIAPQDLRDPALLAEAIAGRSRRSPSPGDVEAFPMSYGQQRMWFVQQLEPGGFWNVPVLRELRGPFDVAAFKDALVRLMMRHESLRTTFVQAGDVLAQVIGDVGRIPVVEVDLTGEDSQWSVVEKAAQDEIRRPFDLSEGPLLRALILRTKTEVTLLCLTFHHSVMDGSSLDLVLRELVELYLQALGHPESHPDLATARAPSNIQYADYSVWQRGRMDAVLQEQLAWWRAHMSGAPATLDLPGDRPRPLVATHDSDRFRGAQLDPALVASLDQLARSHGATLFMAMLAGFSALLGRYARHDDVVIGSPVSGRSRPELDSVVGLFVNLLPFRVSLAGDPTFAELIARVREVALGVLSHQDLPFDRLVEELRPERQLNRSPVFQVQFTLRRAEPPRVPTIPGVAIQPVDPLRGNSPYDLSLLCSEGADGVQMVWDFSTELFDRRSIEAFSERLRVLLSAVVVRPDEPLSKIDVLGEAERRKILVEWNATSHPFPGGAIHELVEAQAAASPDAPAVEFGQSQLSYGEVNRRANQLAHWLRELGVGPDMIVGVCLERSLEILPALLGILKAGGCYLPLDPTYPAERIGFMLEDADVNVLVTTSALLEDLPVTGAAVVLLDGDAETRRGYPVSNPPSVVGPSNLAYLIYTSGSTGRPKGVLVEHRGIVNLAGVVADLFELSERSRVLQFASLSFDASVTELLLPLTVGATVCLAPREELASGPELLRMLADKRITVVTLPPSLLAVLPDTDLPDLRTLCSAGEPCPPAIAERWGRGRRFLNGYGPTEATVAVAYHIVDEVVDPSIALPIGHAIANTEIYILDEHLQPVPVGVVGELYLGGVGLARGYLKRKGLTADRFISHPFTDDPDARLYRSGDLGRFRADGTVEWTGRVDDQVKVRGYRIELGEIEQAITSFPQVRNAVVLAEDDGHAGRRLTAYVIADPQTAPRRSIELWPSVAEYFVYDEALYYAMTHDEERNRAYQVAIERVVAGRTVVDIGTGQDAILSRLCAGAGARKVYALEILEESHIRARDTVAKMGLDDRIEVLLGDARQLTLPEPVDVCVSEIVGAIGGSEGAAVIINDSRRWLRDGAQIIPSRSLTMMAAITLPDELVRAPRFGAPGAHYVARIFEQIGYRFDLRLCLKGVVVDDLVSDEGVFEDLNFVADVPLESDHQVELTIARPCRLDGLLVWLQLETCPGVWIDTLREQHCWLPVFLPVFHPGFDVGKGDVIHLNVSRRLAANGLNPEYVLRGTLTRTDGSVVPFDYNCNHDSPSYRESSFYDLLFAGDVVPVASGEGTPVAVSDLRDHLRRTLPDYMVPATFGFVDSFPSTPNGKIDRNALAASAQLHHDSKAEFVAAGTDVERRLAAIFAEVLGLPKVGIHDGFFDLGGHSLLAVSLFEQVEQEFGVDLPLATLFLQSTVAELAALVGSGVAEAPRESLVTLRPGPGPALFCIRDDTGDVLCYRDIALALPDSQPVYGLRSVSVMGDRLAVTDIEQMAAQYLAEIRGVQPHGPYHLAGVGFGGLVAYEMAAQIERAGDEVGLLAVFDAEPAGLGYGIGVKADARRMRDRLQTARRHMVRTAYHKFAPGLIERGLQVPRILQNEKRLTDVALGRYARSPQIRGSAVVFNVDDGSEPAEDRRLLWGQFAQGGVELHWLRGAGTRSGTMLAEPHASQIAAVLQTVMSSAGRTSVRSD